MNKKILFNALYSKISWDNREFSLDSWQFQRYIIKMVNKYHVLLFLFVFILNHSFVLFAFAFFIFVAISSNWIWSCWKKKGKMVNKKNFICCKKRKNKKNKTRKQTKAFRKNTNIIFWICISTIFNRRKKKRQKLMRTMEIKRKPV